jgi:protease-4
MRRRTRYIILLVVMVIIGGLIVRARLRGPEIKPGSYLLLELRGDYTEGPPQDLLGSLLHRRERTLIDILSLIRKAQADERIRGMIVRVAPLEVGWAKAQDIRDALLEFKHAGKPLVALLEQEASSGNKEYYVASAAERIYLSPNVTAPLNGLQAQFLFLGGVWEKLDIEMDVEKIGAYKSFGDTIANKEMTPAHREMANWLLDSLSQQLVEGVAQARGLEPQMVQQIIDDCPVSPAEFQAARLSNGSKYLEDLQTELGGEDTPLVRVEEYGAVPASSLGLGVGPKIGMVYGVGAIVTGEGGTGVQGESMGSQTVSKALADAAADTDVKAILFRVDSPGGSALASDLVWRATQEARKKKPVVVSMSDVAGSGGYYISAGATQIVAQPATLTGSIGVVLARPNIEGFLARLGINTETISRGKFAGLDNVITPLSADARGKLVAEMNLIYDVFVERVASGRNLTKEQVDALGRGRVFTGAQARDFGLVDELGGLRTALQAAKKAAGIAPSEEVELVFYPRRKGLLERIGELLNARVRSALPAALQRTLRILPVPYESGSVLTLMPQGIDIHCNAGSGGRDGRVVAGVAAQTAARDAGARLANAPARRCGRHLAGRRGCTSAAATRQTRMRARRQRGAPPLRRA